MSFGVPLTPTDWRHAHGLVVLAVSHDGRLVVGGGSEVRVWRAEDGRVEAIVDGPLDGHVLHACFSRQDTFVAFSHGGRVQVWSVVERRAVFDAPWPVRALAPDGDHGFLAAVAEGASLHVRALPSEETRRVLPGKARTVALSGDAVAVASDTEPGRIEVYRGDAPPVVLQGAGAVSWTEARHDLWDNEYTETRTADARIDALAFDPTGDRLAAGGNGFGVQVWDSRAGDVVHSWTFDAREVGGLVWRPDGARLGVSFAPLIGAAGLPHVWDLAAGVVAPAAPGRVIAFCGDRVLAGGSTSRLHTGAPEEDDGAAVIGVGVDPTGRVLVLRTGTGVEAWSMPSADGPGRRLWRDDARESAYTAIVFGPHGDGWTSAWDREGPCVRRFHLDTGFTPTRLGPVPTLTWSLDQTSDGRYLAVGGYEDACAIWDVGAGTVVARLTGGAVHAVRFVPGGAWVADPNGELKRYAWEGEPRGDLAPVRVLTPTGPGSDAAPNDDAHVLEVSADETRAVSGWNDVVRLWDLETGAVIASSAPVDRFAAVRIVGLHPEPFGVVFRRVQSPDGGEAWGWTPSGGDVRLATSTDGLWRYGARGCAVPGGGIVLTGDDGAPRRLAFPSRAATGRQGG